MRRIADALDVVGDRFAFLVLRELAFGVHRFSGIGTPRDTLLTRLRDLEQAGLIARRRYQDRPPRDEYVLPTEAGEQIGPVLTALREWRRKWAR